METFFSLPLLWIERLSFVSRNSFLALISIILDIAGNSIWLFVKREVKMMNAFLILCKAVTIYDTKFSDSAVLM
jgi:hypothetical protein